MLPNVDDIGRFALFLDLDGTVAEIAERPDAVRVDAATIALLDALRRAAGDAVAVVSGRDIAVIDALLSPLTLPVAGVHGLQRRDAAGRMHRTGEPSADLDSVIRAIEVELGREPGVIVERKTGAVALHYRLRPELEAKCRAVAERAARERPDVEILPGKMVFEIRLQGGDKGDVIEAFLKEEPFRGRKPIFAGDDVTDEVAFAAVNALGGLSIKVGRSATLARYRAADLRELHRWLAELARASQAERAR
ncbi:trehalose-phosphatase [Methylosinus sp. H3A]|uniref:trehalose-phosphatase n=1 Tax=Methylosinus sp. H3A TaxID=2785786 RepID=UPI0018C2E67C|nr:trehalose-phosphatase [Methylosinus sp. H3A]MBG0809773.1 trehalose-phosphatase [Methylosinus sp. H3A]